MNLRRLTTGFGKDEKAQALTEFVIVIPVVLLTFFAAIQTMVIAQCSQQVNYAAFIAARSYATSYWELYQDKNKNHTNADKAAQKRARNAATLVMAPVSHAQFGEGLPMWNAIRGTFDGLPEIVENLYGLGEGYVVAYVYRMKIKDSKIIASTPSNKNDPKGILRAEFDYLCPISIPGLSELWMFFYRKKPDATGTISQHYELGAPFVDAGGVSKAINSVQNLLVAIAKFVPEAHNLNLQIDDFTQKLHNTVGFLGAPMNIRITGKCAMGFEPWSGIARHKGGDGTATEDPKLKKCREEMEENQKKIDEQKKKTDDICKEAKNRETTYNQKVADYNACRNDPEHANYPNCGPENTAKNSAYNSWQSKKKECEDEGVILEDLNDKAAKYECNM